MNKPLIMILEETKNNIITSVNQIIEHSSVPAYLLEGIFAAILSDIRAQKNCELAAEYQKLMHEMTETEREGEQDGEH